MSWKRLWLSSTFGFLVMILDGLLLILVNRLYLPGHPPHWLMGTIFYFDAWPVTITQHVFPGRAHGGPSFPAVILGALINLIVITAIIYALLSWRARRKAGA